LTEERGAARRKKGVCGQTGSVCEWSDCRPCILAEPINKEEVIILYLQGDVEGRDSRRSILRYHPMAVWCDRYIQYLNGSVLTTGLP